MVEHNSYTKRTCYEYKTLIDRLKVLVEDGIFLGESRKSSGFLRNASNDILSPDFKGLIEHYTSIEQERGKRKDLGMKNK